MSENGLLFTPDQAAGGGATDFVQDVFVDVTLPATNNTGLTDSLSTNPTKGNFNNNDQVLLSSKILYFKDFETIQDRTKWINSKPTYKFNFAGEDFPAVQVYGYGRIQKSMQKRDTQQFLAMSLGDGFGVTGKIRRVSWLVQAAQDLSTATAQLVTDGANTTTVNIAGLQGNNPNNFVSQFDPRNHQSSNETNDLHDFRIEAITNTALRVYGVIVYFENTSANVQVQPGTTYINKVKSVSSNGATFSVATMGSSLGGLGLVYKTTGGYTQAAVSCSSIIVAAQGVSGTNLISVATGFGGSFLAGMGIVAANGTSNYVGQISSISTDTLTVAPTLYIGFSNVNMYSMWRVGPTLQISPTTMRYYDSIDFSNFSAVGGSLLPSYYNMDKGFNFFNDNFGTTGSITRAGIFRAASGMIVVEGNFQAMDIDFNGVSGNIMNFNLKVDGLDGFTINEGVTGSIKRTVFTDGAPGWHSVVITPGSSLGTIFFDKINLFRRNVMQYGQTFGLLGEYPITQAFTSRTAHNATLLPLGMVNRVYADQLPLTGNWTRGTSLNQVFGVLYFGTSTNAVLSQTYYGRQFAIVGTSGGGTLAVDGTGVALASAFNTMYDPGSEGFHTVTYTSGTGATSILSSFDYCASRLGVNSLTVSELKSTFAAPIPASKIYAKYTEQAGQNIPNNTNTAINFNVKTFDTHNIVFTSDAWRALIPRDGLYEIHASAALASAAGWAEAEIFALQLTINGVNMEFLAQPGLSGATEKTASFNDTIKLKKGDILQMVAYQNNGADIALTGESQKNWITIREL